MATQTQDFADKLNELHLSYKKNIPQLSVEQALEKAVKIFNAEIDYYQDLVHFLETTTQQERITYVKKKRFLYGGRVKGKAKHNDVHILGNVVPELIASLKILIQGQIEYRDALLTNEIDYVCQTLKNSKRMSAKMSNSCPDFNDLFYDEIIKLLEPHLSQYYQKYCEVIGDATKFLPLVEKLEKYIVVNCKVPYQSCIERIEKIFYQLTPANQKQADALRQELNLISAARSAQAGLIQEFYRQAFITHEVACSAYACNQASISYFYQTCEVQEKLEDCQRRLTELEDTLAEFSIAYTYVPEVSVSEIHFNTSTQQAEAPIIKSEPATVRKEEKGHGRGIFSSFTSNYYIKTLTTALWNIWAKPKQTQTIKPLVGEEQQSTDQTSSKAVESSTARNTSAPKVPMDNERQKQADLKLAQENQAIIDGKRMQQEKNAKRREEVEMARAQREVSKKALRKAQIMLRLKKDEKTKHLPVTQGLEQVKCLYQNLSATNKELLENLIFHGKKDLKFNEYENLIQGQKGLGGSLTQDGSSHFGICLPNTYYTQSDEEKEQAEEATLLSYTDKPDQTEAPVIKSGSAASHGKEKGHSNGIFSSFSLNRCVKALIDAGFTRERLVLINPLLDLNQTAALTRESSAKTQSIFREKHVDKP